MAMSSATQQTLTGETIDEFDRDDHRPDTFMVDVETGQIVRRRRRFDHDGELQPFSEWLAEQEADSDSEKSPYEHYDADEEVGEYFDVTISKSVDYRFRVPAHSEHQAKEVAEDWALDAVPADAHVVHTNTRSVGSIERQQLPDDWDPYGGERIHEVLDDA
jgi:hypothetical protein